MRPGHALIPPLPGATPGRGCGAGFARLVPALDPGEAKQVAAAAAVELEASRRDPYRQLSRVFHLVGRKTRADPQAQASVGVRGVRPAPAERFL
jgi:hypothetical protein